MCELIAKMCTIDKVGLMALLDKSPNYQQQAIDVDLKYQSRHYILMIIQSIVHNSVVYDVFDRCSSKAFVASALITSMSLSSTSP